MTVVIPCFNHGEYLDEAVSSALSQTHENLEVVVVDDGSTDARTREFLDGYSRDRTKVLRIANAGPSIARDTGIRAGTGTYILPLDADDRIEPTYVEKAVRLLEADARLGVVYCEANLFGARSGPWELPAYEWPNILWTNPIFVTAVFRRSDWERAGGFERTTKFEWEDWEFWLRMTGPEVGVHRIPERLFWYRISANSRYLTTVADWKSSATAYDRIVRAHIDLYARNAGAVVEHRAYLFRREATARRIALAAVTTPTPLSSYPGRVVSALKLFGWSCAAPLARLIRGTGDG